MNTAEMVAALDAEIARLRQVRELLAGAERESGERRRPGPPKGSGYSAEGEPPTATGRKRRELSPEARERIAAAQRARWAARPKLGNQAPAKAKRGRPAKGAKRTEEESAGETTT